MLTPCPVVSLGSAAADCVYYMHHIERTLLHPRPRGSAELGVSTQDVDSMGVDRMITSGVEVRSGSFGEFWNWGPDRIDQTLGTNNRYSFGNSTGRGTVLYTIDTGIYVHHSDFAGRIVDGYSIGCPTGNEEACRTGQWVHKGYITDDTPTASGFQSDTGERCDSHGTHTASTAAGRLYGVAKEAEIVVVQGLDCNGTASNSMFIAALDWAVGDARRRGKPAVMSMSLGGDRDDLLDQAAQRASAHGFTVVTASGNDGGDSCAMSPGGAKEAISVAAIDQTDTIAPYSNRGACTNLIAPGTGIVAAYIGSSKDSAAALSGTSMATPHVAGAVLQLLQHYPHYTPLDISRALTCMSTKGVVNGLDAQTPNHLLHTGTMLAEAQNAQLLGQIQGASGRDVTAQQMGCLDDPSSGGSQQAHGALQPAPLH